MVRRALETLNSGKIDISGGVVIHLCVTGFVHASAWRALSMQVESLRRPVCARTRECPHEDGLSIKPIKGMFSCWPCE